MSESEPKLGAELRRHPRKRTLWSARIVFNSRFSIIECVVRDLSETGAQISFPHPFDIPEEVELELPKTGQHFRCRVVWSKGKNHGLMFLHDRDALVPADQQIEAVLENTRHRIAEIAGVPKHAVKLTLELKSSAGVSGHVPFNK